MHCSCCGAVRAYPGRERSLCYTCERKYEYFCDKRGDSSENFTQFLINQLSLQVARKKRGGVVGRCEAITKQGTRIFLQHFQCGAPPVTIKNGKKLCAKHLSSRDVMFVHEEMNDLDYLDGLITSIAADDMEFGAMIKGIAARLP
jgi:hypothetical protein